MISSNYSKYLKHEEGIDIQAEVDKIVAQGRYADVYVETVGLEDGSVYYVFKALQDIKNNVVFEKGKIVKPTSFIEPELEQFILMNG